jgi:hypothetical protein
LKALHNVREMHIELDEVCHLLLLYEWHRDWFVFFAFENFVLSFDSNYFFYIVYLFRCINVLTKFLSFIIWSCWNLALSTLIGIC